MNTFFLRSMKRRMIGFFIAWLAGTAWSPAFCFAQTDEPLDYTLDASSRTIPLPKVFYPSIDLSGRGFHNDQTWPQSVAALEVIDGWRQDIGFKGFYRLQYNLWEISQLAKAQDAQKKKKGNYDALIKKINDDGGIAVVTIFGTPAGFGKVLDKTSSPLKPEAYKSIVKSTIRELSCNKKYIVWYEVWSAPDLDEFFIGRKQEYLALYKIVADSIKELEQETKINIPVGGPSTSWWFQNSDGNTIVQPENSLVYELIKFCSRYKLPLDFISWHAYSTDPAVEKETTAYNKSPTALIRDWLSYFHFDKNTPLIVDEWNYDSGANMLSERKESSFICASYVPARLSNMFEAGIDYQSFFSLEDFQNNKEGVIRNVGIFWYGQEGLEYKGGEKAVYPVFKMLRRLGPQLYLPATKFNDTYIDVIATRTDADELVVLISNYIDPDSFRNYLSRNVSLLSSSERKMLFDLLDPDKLEKIVGKQVDISRLAVTGRVKGLVKKALETNDRSIKFMYLPRTFKLTVKNLLIQKNAGAIAPAEGTVPEATEKYLYQRYVVDSSCGQPCAFSPVEEKEVDVSGSFQLSLSLNPYSVTLVVLKKKPAEPPALPSPVTEEQVKAEVPAAAETAPSAVAPAEQPAMEKEEVKPSVDQEKKADKAIVPEQKKEKPAQEPGVPAPAKQEAENNKGIVSGTKSDEQKAQKAAAQTAGAAGEDKQ